MMMMMMMIIMSPFVILHIDTEPAAVFFKLIPIPIKRSFTSETNMLTSYNFELRTPDTCHVRNSLFKEIQER